MVTPFSEAVLKIELSAGDHLWQSSVFALIAAGTTLLFAKNQARVRYSIWLAASLKFLLPFDVLISLGKAVGPPHTGHASSRVYSTVQAISQPLAQPPVSFMEHASGNGHWFVHLPDIVLFIWAIGLVAVVARWWIQWRRLAFAKYTANPMIQGREIESLRHLEALSGVKSPTTLLSSSDPLEPGVLGIFRPVLLWPAGISEELQDAQVDAILAHEVQHIQRKDNLAAAIHMLVEAVFWFNPLVWWLGARLLEERERACDEGVLKLGSEPAVYAESILRTCRFCLESTLPCVSGVNGSNLKQRIVRIMSHQIKDRLSFGRRTFLTSLVIATVAAPLFVGILKSPKVSAQSTTTPTGPSPALEVVSLKQNRSGSQMNFFRFGSTGMKITNATLKNLIESAYGVQDYQLIGGPSWLSTQRFDIELRRPGVASDSPDGPLPGGAVGAVLQKMLDEQFHLIVNHGTTEMPGYQLVLADSGPKLIEVPIQSDPLLKEPVSNSKVMVRNESGQLSMTGRISLLVNAISANLGGPVEDKTGLSGNYDVMLHWSKVPNQAENLTAALQEQLGLKLEPRQQVIQTIAVSQVEMPTEK